MSDQTTHARIELSVEDRASNVVRSLRGEIEKTTKALKALTDAKMPAGLKAKIDGTGARDTVNGFTKATAAAGKLSSTQAQASRQRQADTRVEATSRRMFDAQDMAALKSKLGFQARMGRQRAQAEAAADRQRRSYDAACLRDFRQKFAFEMRMGRQRQAETREAERAEAAANRTRIAGERQVRQEHDRTRREAVRYGKDTWSRGRDAVREIARPPAAVAAAGAVGAVAGARRVLRAEGDVDSSEINARIYGGLTADAARKLRDRWAAPLAETLGAQTDKLLDAYTEATKLGIPAAGAGAFAELATKTSEAWSVPFDTVTSTLGTVNSILTSKGAAFDGGKLKSVANTLQHLAAKQSTTPEKLISFLQRGAGGADVLGMSMESALAFGSASTSLGNQAGQSGSLLDYLAGRVVEMPKLVRQHGQEGKQARQLLNALGYGSADEMDARRRKDPDAFLPDLMNRFSKIKDPKQQDQSIRFFAGREWLGEFGRMVKGADTYREAVKLAKEAKGFDAISAVWDLHRLKLSFVFKQFKAGWLNILGEFGKVLSPMARQAGDYFMEWSSKLRSGGLQARFRAALNGLIEGFGFRNLPDLLKGIFGAPGEGDAGAISTWKATAREFSAGISDVVGSIKAVVGAFTGGSPETIARWTGRILALSAALVVLGPVLSILGGLASGIIALVSAASGLTAAGIVGAGVWTTVGGLIGVAFLAAVADKLGILKAPDMKQGWGRGILEFLDPGIASRVYGDPKPETGSKPAWSDPPARVQRQSSTQDWRGLVKPAAFDPASEIARNTARMAQAVTSSGATVQLAALNGATLGALGRAFPGAGGTGGGVSGGGAGVGPSGFPKAPGMTVPGWYGRGGGSGSGVTDPGLTGDVATRAKAAHDFFRSKGLSEEATAGILASMKKESNFTPNARGDGGKAHGLFQHHADRRAQIQAATGINMSTASFQQQLEGAWWEMQHGDAGAQRALKILKQPGISAREAGGAFVQHFERPARDERGERGALAEGMLRQFGGTATGTTGDVGSRIGELQRTGAIVGRQCVDLVKSFSGSAASVLSWRKGEAAEAGNLKPGTPIATYLNRNGTQSDRYAGGGTGTPGAGLDHAAIFKSYVKDAAGKIVGMNVAEQYAGSGGVHDKVYRFGQGRGERNGSNYHAVLDQNGQPLGNRNPMRTATTAAATAAEAAKKATTLATGAQETVDGFTTTGWKKRNAFGGTLQSLPADDGSGASVNEFVPNRGDKRTVPLPPRRPGAPGLANQVPTPTPPRRPTADELAGQAAKPRPVRLMRADGSGSDGGSGGGTVIHAPVHINAGSQSPSQIAGSFQRHVAEARNFRAQDLEPELT